MPSFISLSEAQDLTFAYQDSEMAQGQTIALSVDNDMLQQVLDQEGVVGTRFYLSLTDEGKLTLVVVGVNENNEDMTDGLLLDDLDKCPPHCPTSSPLMQ